MKERTFNISLLASMLVHMAIIAAIVIVGHPLPLSKQAIISIKLVDLPRSPEKKEAVPLPKPTSPPPRAAVRAAKPAPLPVPSQKEPAKAENFEAKKNEPEKFVTPSSSPGGGDTQSLPLGTPGIGSGMGNLFGNGDAAVRRGEGLGKSGTGRGMAPPGPGAGERGFRPAKPIQIAKASYPPMALRMGLEADVTLKVYVDPEGKVTQAEIVKSAGMGFDEEAVRTVQQFRFEPARKDGINVASEFTYIYRFRLAN